MQRLRTLFQLAVLAAVLVTGARFALGWSRTSIETYCPFGGLEAGLSLFTQRQFTCATGERNLALMLALIVLALLARKAFCGWVCPVGALSEWLRKAGLAFSGLLGRRPPTARRHLLEPPRRMDRALRWLRLPVLALILYFTYRTGELIFRGYDPYYVLFSFQGHEVQAWSYVLLGVILLGGVVLPMAWCRYLCPLGVALWPFSAAGRLRLKRDAAACAGCGDCDKACPHSIVVSTASEVRSGECTLCLECTAVCRERQALALRLPGWPRVVTPLFVPLAVVALAAGGLGGARLLSVPSVELEVAQGAATAPADRQVLVTVVDGVRCVDTATRLGRALAEVPGVLSFVAYASYGRVEIAYDASRISPQGLRQAIEGPIWDEPSGEYLFHLYRVIEIDGRRLSR